MADEPLQARVNELLKNDTEARPLTETDVPIPFSPFVHDHAKLAGGIVGRMFEAAESADLSAAITVAEETAQTESAGLAKRAIKIFVTHHPDARRALTLPSVATIETRAVPEAETPPAPASATPSEAAHTPWEPDIKPLPPGEEDQAAAASITEPRAERALDWFREDPFANDHHSHWHDVYPTSERGGGPLVNPPRQGELFFYMHQQMLARYDTERTIAGLGTVEPFGYRYEDAIPEGYGRPGYATRGPGATLHDVPRVPSVDALRAWYVALDAALRSSKLQVDGADLGTLDENQLGAAAEPSDLYLRPGQDLDITPWYGNLHGIGHVLVANVAPFDQNTIWPGVMNFVETAIRDPFFYRWHRHVDQLYARLQDELGENSYGQYAAKVRFREPADGPSILLCFSEEIPGASEPGFDFDAFGRARFGEDLDGADLGRDTLLTGFARSLVTAPVPGGRETYWTTHLQHRPFSAFFRIENGLEEQQRVTLRVFLAHENLANDRRMWIELDKFDATLKPGVNVVGRPDALSSVIKRKGVDAPGAQPPNGDDAWCDCGWPYSLLLPSGASDAAGTHFKLMVAATDWEQDRVGSRHSCGSMSYCGATDEYPDARRMGFPFDRRFPATIAETITREASMTMRDISIRCVNPRPPE
jgi:tyrosinase